MEPIDGGGAGERTSEPLYGSLLVSPDVELTTSDVASALPANLRRPELIRLPASLHPRATVEMLAIHPLHPEVSREPRGRALPCTLRLCNRAGDEHVLGGSGCFTHRWFTTHV